MCSKCDSLATAYVQLSLCWSIRSPTVQCKVMWADHCSKRWKLLFMQAFLLIWKQLSAWISPAQLRKGLQIHGQRLLKAPVSPRYVCCESCALFSWSSYSPESLPSLLCPHVIELLYVTMELIPCCILERFVMQLSLACFLDSPEVNSPDKVL